MNGDGDGGDGDGDDGGGDAVFGFDCQQPSDSAAAVNDDRLPERRRRFRLAPPLLHALRGDGRLDEAWLATRA